MKRIGMLSLLMVIMSAFSTANADQYVSGYYRNNGVYVQPHHQTAQDGNLYNNYTTRGNINPYTGEPGTVEPFPTSQQRYNAPRTPSASSILNRAINSPNYLSGR